MKLFIELVVFGSMAVLLVAVFRYAIVREKFVFKDFIFYMVLGPAAFIAIATGLGYLGFMIMNLIYP